MKVVLDTNVLLTALPRKSPYRPIFDAIIDGHVEICVNYEIILEYEEILRQRTNAIVAQNIIRLLTEIVNVVNDHHFKVLETIPFPKVKIISSDNFLILLKK